ncbi:MAG: hypothetical protein BWY85_02105 [Firmicutes bacterium ADurb.Bin506]|nr:MAG: hypothetical protein BWY85_02105 [Firmicutes bacterium ADurb.Bin506]
MMRAATSSLVSGKYGATAMAVSRGVCDSTHLIPLMIALVNLISMSRSRVSWLRLTWKTVYAISPPSTPIDATILPTPCSSSSVMAGSNWAI